MAIKDSPLMMTISQILDANNAYPYCLPYGVAVVTLGLDTGGKTDVAGSELAITPPTDTTGMPYGSISNIVLPDTQGYSFTPGNNVVLVNETPFTWPAICQVTVKLNPTDTQYLSSGTKISGIAEYIPSGEGVQTAIEYFLNVAKMTITGQKEDDIYPGIKPGSTGTVTLELDTQGSLDASGAKLVIAAPAGTTITGVNLPSAAAGTWTQTLSDDGSSATVTLTADGVLWSSCEVTLQVDDSSYGGITEASAEYYHTGSESATPDATGQYGIVVQAVNPSSIHLKGLFLDLGATVGGTRNVYNNGVMCAKFYVGFSYDAVPGDITTVQDVINWLEDNASLRTCASNHTDNGVPSDFGWTNHGNDDPNGGKYVFDTQVLVPANDEDSSQEPEDSIWYYEYFLQPTEGNTTPINVYLTFDYTGKDNTISTESTLTDAILTLSPQVWGFNTSSFYVYKEKESNMGCVTYNQDTVPDYNIGIHYILGFSHDILEVTPSTDNTSFDDLKDLYELPFSASSDDSTEITYNRVFYIVACDYNASTITALVDNKEPIDFAGIDHTIHQQSRCVCKPSAMQFDWTSHIKTKSISTHPALSSNLKSGAIIARWTGHSIEQYDNDGNYAEHLDVFEGSEAVITVRVEDSFGQLLDVKMTLGDDDQNMDDWGIQDVSVVS